MKYLISILFCFALSTSAVSQTTDPVKISGEWEINYFDHKLGNVTGSAIVNDEESSVTVTLKHPETGTEYSLISTEMARTGEKIEITLTGNSPSAERELGLNLADNPLQVPLDFKIVTFGHRGAVLEVPISPRLESDLGKVKISLAITRDALIGHWSYKADPVTFRDTEGFGRTGFNGTSDDGQAYQTGIETWVRPSPEIFGVVPIQEQLAIAVDEPAHPYPFSGDDKGSSTRRHLFVFGKNLPQSLGEIGGLRAEGAHIDYRLAYFSSSEGRGGFGSDLIARGREKLLDGLDPSMHSEASELDYVIIEAQLKPGVVPGHKRFFLDDVEAGWLLQFGDNSATINFVRKVREPETNTEFTPEAFSPIQSFLSPDGYEDTSSLYLPETIRIEVRTNTVLPAEEIPLIVSQNGVLQNFGEASELLAIRTNNPQVYRTGPIKLVHEGESGAQTADYQLETSLGSQLSARVSVADLISIPSAVPTARVTRREFSDSSLWEDAFTRAARCRGIAVENWRTLSSSESDTISNTIILDSLPFSSLDINVTFSDHAAMILLRDHFLESLRSQDREINSFQTDEEIRIFRAIIEPAIRSGTLLMAQFPVTSPDGTQENFARTYERFAIAESYHQSIPQSDAWVIAATREAIREMRLSIRNAIQHAESVGECDVEDLVQLTGLGFDNMVKSILPRLMVPPKSSAQNASIIEWQPDLPARAAVNGIKTLASAVTAQQDYSDTDANFVRATAAIAVLPLTLGSSAIGTAINFVADTVDLAFVALSEIPDSWKSHQEFEFARGASAVLGTYRYDLAEKNRQSIALTAASTVLSSASFVKSVSEIPDAYLKFQSSIIVARVKSGREIIAAEREGQNLFNRANQSGSNVELPNRDVAESNSNITIANASPEARSQGFSPSLSNAEAYDALPGQNVDAIRAELREDANWLDDALDAIAKQDAEDVLIAARNADDIAARLRNYSYVNQAEVLEQDWAKDIPEEIYSSLEPHLKRPDIIKIVASSPIEFSNLLRLEGQNVISTIWSTPVDDIAALSLAVAANKKRIRGTKGADFYSRWNPANENQIKRIRDEDNIVISGDTKFFEERTAGLRNNGGSITITFRDIDPNVDRHAYFDRRFDQATATLTLENAQIESMSRWIKAADVPLVEGRGVPTTLAANLRAMNVFGIGYGGSGVPLMNVKLSNVVNPRTAVQLQWLRNSYPEIPVNELVRHTFSFKYAEDAINLAGYRISGVQIEDGFSSSVRSYGRFYAGSEDWKQFSTRYGFEQHENVQGSYDINISVEPLQ
ncbi:MAG: hypothetical protein AAF198_01990 [Pseudomonadota bacterium]